MTDLRQAAQQALEALENLTTYDSKPSNIWRYFYPSATGDYVNLREFKDLAEPAITALRAALAEPVQPVAWQINDGTSIYVTDRPVDAEEAAAEGWVRTPLYTAPPQPEQEPVAWMHPDGRIWTFGRGFDKSTFTIPLYTASPQRKPLTDEEIRDLWSWAMTAEAERTATTQQHAFARAIERAHGIGGDA